MLTGTVAQLLQGKRLGFVLPVGGGIPLLFRALAVEGVLYDELTEGQAVTYTMERDMQGRGARAIHVRPVGGGADAAPPDA
jgi:cold shock CspA family protein